MKQKRAKPVLAWGLKTPHGILLLLLYHTKREALVTANEYGFGDKPVRVEIREIREVKK